MKALIIVMLAVQAAIFVVTAWTILTARSGAGRPRPIWSSLGLSLIVVAGTSWQIADKHAGDLGDELVMYFSPMLLGMGIMACLLQLRRARGLDATP